MSPLARTRWPCAAALLWALAGLQGASAQTRSPATAAAGPLAFTAEETRSILQLGPWPPAPANPGLSRGDGPGESANAGRGAARPAGTAVDAGNALSGRPAAIALGQRLFFDRRLSPDGRLACASCHLPGQAFADGLPRGPGREPLTRNTPSLWNAAQQRWYGWDGAFDSLWSQALQPLQAPQEIAATPAHLRVLLQSDAELACRWQAATGSAVPSEGNETALLVPLAKALGAFVVTLQSGRTPFDAYRDALARRDTAAMARYPAAAQRGLRLFIGEGRCITCHGGPMFSHGEFADIGLPFFVRPGVVDPGRHAGIATLQANPFNLLGPHSDAGPDDPAVLKTRHVLQQHRNFGEFKVPSLRNVALTAPYGHDGQLAALADVVRHYAELNIDRLHADGEQILRPLRWQAAQQADMLAFLNTLTDPGARRWQAPPLPPCPRRPRR